MTEYKRKHPRVDTLNLLSYVTLDVDGKEWSQGMGRTLNISANGMQLETHEPLDPRSILVISVGIENEVIEVKGKVVYTNRGENKMFDAGIEFIEVKQDDLVVLKKYVAEFNKLYK